MADARKRRLQKESPSTEITISREGTISIQNVTEAVLKLAHAVAPHDPSIMKRMRVLEAASRRANRRRTKIAKPNRKRD